MALDIWFRPDVARILASAEQAARRDKSGERQAGALEVLDDLRLAFGLDERQEPTRCRVIEARQIDG